MTETAASGPRVFIDGDGAPRAIKDIVFRAAERRDVRVVIVANRPVSIPRHARISAVKVSSGLDVADDWLVENAGAGDLVITSDVPLAASLIANGVAVITPRGEAYTASNIGEKLSLRDFFTEARESGVIAGGGPPPMDARAVKAFAGAFDRWLTAAFRSFARSGS